MKRIKIAVHEIEGLDDLEHAHAAFKAAGALEVETVYTDYKDEESAVLIVGYECGLSYLKERAEDAGVCL